MTNFCEDGMKFYRVKFRLGRERNEIALMEVEGRGLPKLNKKVSRKFFILFGF